MDLGESFIESLVREFLEETGYKIKVKNSQPAFVDTHLFGSCEVDQYFQRISMYFNVQMVGSKRLKDLDEETIGSIFVIISACSSG